MHKSIHGTGNPGAFYQFQNTLFHVKQNLFQYQMLVILLKFFVHLKCDFYFPFLWTTGRNVLKVRYIMQDNYQFTQETKVISLLKGFKFQHSVVAAAVINLDIELGRYSYLGDNWFPPWNNLTVFTSENIFLIIDSFWLVICKIIAMATNVSSLRCCSFFVAFFSFKKVFNNLPSSETFLILSSTPECYKC